MMRLVITLGFIGCALAQYNPFVPSPTPMPFKKSAIVAATIQFTAASFPGFSEKFVLESMAATQLNLRSSDFKEFDIQYQQMSDGKYNWFAVFTVFRSLISPEQIVTGLSKKEFSVAVGREIPGCKFVSVNANTQVPMSPMPSKLPTPMPFKKSAVVITAMQLYAPTSPQENEVSTLEAVTAAQLQVEMNDLIGFAVESTLESEGAKAYGLKVAFTVSRSLISPGEVRSILNSPVYAQTVSLAIPGAVVATVEARMVPYAPTAMPVSNPTVASTGLSAGSIICIVIGVIIGCCLLVGGPYYYIKVYRPRKILEGSVGTIFEAFFDKKNGPEHSVDGKSGYISLHGTPEGDKVRQSSADIGSAPATF
jgi:hypothetical protein